MPCFGIKYQLEIEVGIFLEQVQQLNKGDISGAIIYGMPFATSSLLIMRYMIRKKTRDTYIP